MSRKDAKGRVLRTGESHRSDGRYVYRYTERGGKTVNVYAATLNELREKEKQLNRDKDDGIDFNAGKKKSLNEVFDMYMSTKVNLKQSTRTNYLYMYNNYVRDSLGLEKIGAIRYTDIVKFYNRLIIEKGFKPNSMEIINTILHPTFTLAVRNNYIRTNITDGVMAEIKNSHNWEKPKRHALTEDEQSAFLDYMKNSCIYRHWLPLFTVLLGTGGRIGEIIGLRWDDCDFNENTISINHNLVYRQQDNGCCEFHVTTPKTSKGVRMVPMLSEVKTALLEERKKQMANGFSTAEVDGYTGFVFLNRCDYIHNPMTVNRAIKRIYTAHNQEEEKLSKEEKREPVLIRHFSAHNLRHTFCTRFCENEQNIKVIQEIMGHADISTTMDIYAEATEKKKKETFANLEGKIKIS